MNFWPMTGAYGDELEEGIGGLYQVVLCMLL
jgi:hypothetical protein